MYLAKLRTDGTIKSVIRTKRHTNITYGLIEVDEYVYKNIGKIKWDFDTNSWVELPKCKRKITKQEFFDLFTDQQFEAIADSDNAKVKTFLLKVRMMDSIDTESNYIETALNRLENPLGLIGVGEAIQILAEAQVLAES